MSFNPTIVALTLKLRWRNHQPNAQSVLIVLPCGSATVPAQQTPTTIHGLPTAPAVSEKSERIETGTMAATIEDTDPDLERSVEIEVGPETGQRRPVGSGATQGKEAGGDIKMTSEMGREKGRIGNGAEVETSTDHGEVGALALIR